MISQSYVNIAAAWDFKQNKNKMILTKLIELKEEYNE